MQHVLYVCIGITSPLVFRSCMIWFKVVSLDVFYAHVFCCSVHDVYLIITLLSRYYHVIITLLSRYYYVITLSRYYAWLIALSCTSNCGSLHDGTVCVCTYVYVFVCARVLVCVVLAEEGNTGSGCLALELHTTNLLYHHPPTLPPLIFHLLPCSSLRFTPPFTPCLPRNNLRPKSFLDFVLPKLCCSLNSLVSLIW